MKNDETALPLRDLVAEVMMDGFEATGESYNPDACWMVADRIVAALASRLLGVDVEARHHPRIIGPAEFVIHQEVGEL